MPRRGGIREEGGGREEEGAVEGGGGYGAPVEEGGGARTNQEFWCLWAECPGFSSEDESSHIDGAHR